MLHQASNVNAIADFPWTLAPAAAIVAVTFAANVLIEGGEREDRPAATREDPGGECDVSQHGRARGPARGAAAGRRARVGAVQTVNGDDT